MTQNTSEALDTLLNPAWLGAACNRPVQAIKLRIKPDTSILCALQNLDSGIVDGWARILWPDGLTKAKKTEQWANQHGLRVTTTILPSDLVFQYGEIAADPKLHPYLQPEFLGFELGDLQHILRYNPSRRLVYRHKDTIVRISEKQDELGYELHQFLSTIIQTPARLDHGENRRLSISQVVGDSDLSQMPNFRATRQAGRILAKLHAETSSISTGLSAKLAKRSTNFESQIKAHEHIFQSLAPDLAGKIRTIAAHIPRHIPGAPVLLHGDASPDQFLVSKDNSQLWLTDFDRARLGPAAYDLGSYLSVVDSSSGQALMEGYADIYGALPPPMDLRAAQLQSLLMRIAEPLRSGNPNWRSITSAALAEVERLL
ncbi:aminoglycoside phosphotransferase family protein [Corynebacterium freiburgense]|uniref:aminoglycoside phosphotransferase family protein n=1 Tax=Corynebacterium freiburgense TaxID=556548 RepID=UPI00041ADD23|nr:aminoglycoside phosphotransferase family protein [Corynebacterium freiburgense]WJZ03056.1 serine/threonine protein kinase [Corynebacterium freiburgense]